MTTYLVLAQWQGQMLAIACNTYFAFWGFDFPLP